MARQGKNVVMHGLTGMLYGQVLFKQYSYGTVVSKIPDRSNVVLSEKQKKSNRDFLRAVKYAQQVLKDPVKGAEYQSTLPKGKTIYHAAIADYFAQRLK